MAAPNRVDPASPLTEVVLLGPHPDHPHVQVLVLGTSGEDGAWQAAVGLAGVVLGAAPDRFLHQAGLVVVDVRSDRHRLARGLRHVRSHPEAEAGGGNHAARP